MTRDEAIKIAKEHAQGSIEDHEYMIGVDEPDWIPHEWVIEAILRIAEEYETNIRM